MTASKNSAYAQDILNFFEAENIVYCVVGDSVAFPQEIPGDIDIVVAPGDLPMMGKLLSRFCEKYGQLFLVQLLQHEETANYFALALLAEESTPVFLHPDICGDYLRNGKFMLAAEEILEGRIEATDNKGVGKGFYVPGPPMEFIYYLLKKIDKQELRSRHGVHLAEEWKKDPSGCRKQIHRFWNGEDAEILALAAESNEWGSVEVALADLQQSLHKVLNFSLMAWWRELLRKVHRVLEPTGLLVVILGPDGSGKSSVIDKIIPDLAPAFRKTQYIHLRPSLGRENTGRNTPVDAPHSRRARGRFASVVKVFYLLFDYCVGYLLRIRPMLVRSTFVVFDRYYHDLMVDPKRYRFSGPLWFARSVAGLVPKPDVTILLDAPADLIQARKKEVPLKETERQREEYLRLVGEMQNGIVIDASQPLESVVTDVNKAILDVMSERTRRRLGYCSYSADL